MREVGSLVYMNFNNIIGQEEVINSLKKAMEGDRVGHAYIFTGPSGIGKKTIAGIFAVALLCENRGAAGGCGECVPCRMLAGGSDPDLFLIGQNNGSIKIEEIRKIQSDIIIKPLYSPRKVYLITDADAMTVQAQNCLLKILEEPPRYAVIILTASNYDALLETVRSRTLRYNFKKNTFDEIRGLLESKLGKSQPGIEFMASYADGVIGMALELADSDEFTLLRRKTFDMLLQIKKSRLLDIFEAFDFFDAYKGSIDTILDIMLLYYRDLLVLKETGNENMLINSDKKDIILDNVSAYSLQKLMEGVEVIESTRRSISQNVNYQLSIEVMLMRLQEELV